MSASPLSRLLLPLALVGVALSGCFCGPPPLPDPPAQCDANGVGCLPDEACMNGECIRFERCDDDDDCPSPHYRCTFPAQLCELRPGFDLECVDNNDCEPEHFCALGRCRPRDEARPCGNRGDCQQGQACSRLHLLCIEEAPCTLVGDFPEVGCDFGEMCDPVSERCVLPCQNECTMATEAEDCDPGERCDAACRCVQCITNADCGLGLVCNVRQGRCQSENLCYSDEDCELPLICDPATALCQVPPPPCEDDLDCSIAEICNRVTGVCELPGGACIDDRLEDADTPAQAEDINVPNDGTLVVVDELQLCPDDDDVYAFALDAGDVLVASVEGTLPQARAAVWMLDSEGETSVAFAQTPPYGNGMVTYGAQTAETVYLRVTALVAPSPYELAVSRNPGQPCMADVFEGDAGNDTEATATAPGSFPLEQTLVATLCPEDVDYYGVDLAAGEGLAVTVGFDDTTNDLDVDLIDLDSGELLARAAGVTSPEEVRIRTQSMRRVAAFVRGFGNKAGPYTVAFERLEPFTCAPDVLEPDGMAAPTVVPSGMSSLDAGRTLCLADNDVYRVPLLDFERLVAQATFQPAELDVRIEVLDAAGESVLATSPNAGGVETVTYDAQGNEEVLVRFTGLLNTQGTYDAAVFRENQLDCAPDDLEPNNAVSQAVPAPGMPVSLSMCGSDNDVFSVEGTAGKRLVARASFLHSDADIDVMILGQNGTQILSASDSTTNLEEAQAVLPLDGTFYVRVFSLSDGAAARYTLEIELTN